MSHRPQPTPFLPTFCEMSIDTTTKNEARDSVSSSPIMTGGTSTHVTSGIIHCDSNPAVLSLLVPVAHVDHESADTPSDAIRRIMRRSLDIISGNLTPDMSPVDNVIPYYQDFFTSLERFRVVRRRPR